MKYSFSLSKVLDFPSCDTSLEVSYFARDVQTGMYSCVLKTTVESSQFLSFLHLKERQGFDGALEEHELVEYPPCTPVGHT